MKTLASFAIAVVLLCAVMLSRSSAQGHSTAAVWEYTTIRWAGKENTHLIRPGGQVEFIGTELRKLQRPERCDERSFYMNAAVNGLAKEGWELAGMTPDDILMKRPAR
jgi:hypothetical protein